MFKRTKTTSALALIFILTALLANCVPSTQTGNSQTFTIAVVEASPGEVGNPDPDSAYAGVKLAAEQMQAHGGLSFEVVPYFDNGNATIAEQRANEIVDGNAIAVIGHSSIETSRAAADVYNKAGVSVLNYVPVTETLTDEYSNFFNTTYTAESEAAYLANYLRKINGIETATIIKTNDGYGQTLAKQFRGTFQGLGGQITFEDTVRSLNARDLEDVVSNIISASSEIGDPGTIFIATDEETAAQLLILMKRKGVSYPIVGASTLSTPGFLDLILAQPEEETIPGYFTDGILTTRALIFDSANRYANQFRHEYQTVYNSDPGDRVVNGYDTALVLMTAIQNAGVTGLADEIETDRQKTYKALLALDDSQSSVQGIVAPVYFEPSRNITRAARFGIYQNSEVVSANTQFEPISIPGEVKDLQEQIDKGRIMTVNGAYAYKANVVYAGVDLLGIEEIDIKTSTYKVDFYLWFRYRPNDQDEDFKPDDFVFTNAEGDVESVLIREEPNSDGTFLKTYRVSGIFKNQFQFYDYPFDHQDLIIEFRNQNANTSFIQYVVDQVGMRYTNENELLENFRDNGAFDAIYGWDEIMVHVTQDIFPTLNKRRCEQQAFYAVDPRDPSIAEKIIVDKIKTGSYV
jgi:branched-chain amino acid transport system substrate-binding protein